MLRFFPFKLIEVFFIVLFTALFFASVALNLPNFMLIMLILFFCCIVALALKQSGTELFLGFLVTFFVYLLGRYTVLLFAGENWFGSFSINTAKCIVVCLFLSLLFVYLGFHIMPSRSIDNSDLLNYEEYAKGCNRVKTISKYVFYLTILFSIIENLEAAVFVQANSYVSYYTSFSSNLPSIVIRMSKVSDFAFFIFIATLPSKKELKGPVVLFLLSSCITFFSGSRGGIVNSILFTFLYYLFRSHNENNPSVKWITKSTKILMFAMLPFAIVFLSIYNTLRNDVLNYTGFFGELLTFFVDQGGSANVIGYTELYKDTLPDSNVSYFFGPIISFFKYGTIGRLFTGAEAIKNNTVEMALYGNNLGATISYYVMPNGWTSGLGLGTQYIAEAYADFGYMGVIIFNFILGILIRKSTFIYHKSWIVNALYINVIMFILRMPRNNALSFVPELISLSNWALIILVLLLSRSGMISKKANN
jgi:oligosaccharide repeat unit polymerase